jgi:hypothetical protein
MKSALEARSYKKELILVAYSLHKLGGLIQLLSNLEALGYTQVLLLSCNREECEGFLAIFPGCADATEQCFESHSFVDFCTCLSWKQTLVLNAIVAMKLSLFLLSFD